MSDHTPLNATPETTQDPDAGLRETQVASALMHQGKFLTPKHDIVRLPDGRNASREYLIHPGAVMMIPLFDDGTVLMERQFRYPVGKDQHMAYKATVIKLAGGKAGVAFDRNTLKVVAGWTGGFVNISDRRFGLMNTPTPKGTMTFAFPAGPGWADRNGKWDARVTRYTAPLPKEWAKFKGYYLQDDRVTLKYTVGESELELDPIDKPGLVEVESHSLDKQIVELEVR